MRRKRILTFMLLAALTASLVPVNAAAAKKIKLTNTPANKIMRTGSTFSLKTNYKASSLTFSSSQKTVATVSDNGLISARKKGKTTITISNGSSSKKLKITVKSPSGYRISKKAGSYSRSVTTTVKAKKGYNVYYSTTGKFQKRNVILSGKSKAFTFQTTTTLYLYPVKTSKKMSTSRLNRTRLKNKRRADYRYTIQSTSDAEKESTAPPAAADATTSPLAVTTPGNSAYQSDDSASDYIAPVRAEYDSIDVTDTADEGATEITLPTTASGTKIATDTYEISKKNKLTILAPGTYVIHTESTETASDGLIEVDYADEDTPGTVHLILDGVNLTSSNNTEPTSDTGLVTIKKSVTRAVITIPGGTAATLTDTGETGIDKDDNTSTTYTGGIVCKKVPLTINGSGTLTIYSANGNGIKATDTLKILDTTIDVSGNGSNVAGHNGISGKTGLFTKNANLSVRSNGDALKTTLDKDDIAVDTTGTLASLGNMEIDGGSFHLVSANGDGISSYRTLYLNPSDMDVTTQNETASTEDSSYKAVKAGTTIYIPESAGTITADTTATYSASRSQSDSNDPVADDTLHCDGYIRIDGGTLCLSAGDDGIHSDSGLVINAGTITIKSSYEGLESGDITINGGDIDITSRDDGMNAAGGNNSSSSSQTGAWDDIFSKGESAANTNYQIIINGGTITIDADGDGIDSNGSIFFKGGSVTVNGPTNGGNGALDYGDGSDCVCEISGGTLIASGAIGMDAAPTSGSSQPAVNVRLSSSQSAGTYIVLKDSSGNTILTAQPSKTFQSIIMSCEELKLGSSYIVYYGSSLNNLTQSTSFTLTSTSVATSSSSSGPGDGWNPGRPGSNRP